jgi:predicted nucleotidyltransferase
MKPSDALITHRNAIQQVASRYAVKNIRVLGSVIHWDDKEDSDLDLLVDPLPGTTLLDSPVVDDALIMAEPSLAADWLNDEEEAAWKHLNEPDRI